MQTLSDCALILSAGMPRSGSTWLYNAIRLALGSTPGISGQLSAGWIGDVDRLPRRKLLLLKLHAYNEVWARQSIVSFYSYRDIRDVVASQSRKFAPPPNILGFVDRVVTSHEYWMQKASYSMRYEDMLAAKAGILSRVLHHLHECGIANRAKGHLHRNETDLLEALASLQYDSDGQKNGRYNEVNLYHRGHITDGRHGSWNTTLEASVAAEIVHKYQWWFVKYGYPLT